MTQKYTPTKWVANETIGTANVMNNIEQGIVGAYDEIERVGSQLLDIENEVGLRIDEVDSKVAHISNLVAKSNIYLSNTIRSGMAPGWYIVLDMNVDWGSASIWIQIVSGNHIYVITPDSVITLA